MKQFHTVVALFSLTIGFVWGVRNKIRNVAEARMNEPSRNRTESGKEILLSQVLRGPTSESCLQRYQSLFRNHRLEVWIVFGYKDSRPARYVGDRYEKMVLRRWLLQRCGYGEYACGFVQDSEDGDLLMKETIGPDGNLRPVLVHLTHSSVGPDDDENRKDPFQEWRSQYAESRFATGIKEGNVVFYDGHSRAGGGPDFSPPRTFEGNLVDYSWYSVNRPGVTALLAHLATSSQIQLLGLFSCLSTSHFAKKILEKKPSLGLITSRKLLYYRDALKQMRRAMDALLGMWCSPTFDPAIEAESKNGTSVVTNFFR